MDTSNNCTPPAYGNTNPIRYGSTWQLMIPGSNILEEGNLQHLYNVLQKETYNIGIDHAGKLYCGINLK
jgi:hypothetical protein